MWRGSVVISQSDVEEIAFMSSHCHQERGDKKEDENEKELGARGLGRGVLQRQLQSTKTTAKGPADKLNAPQESA